MAFKEPTFALWITVWAIPGAILAGARDRVPQSVLIVYLIGFVTFWLYIARLYLWWPSRRK